VRIVFLGEDNSVKLGDFGLAKMIQSHDFASTYVGTPFYMSPEICAAEKYTLKSDIWSLGCIIYELCSREPPFNAKSHFQLVQKIKEGKISALPSIYSAELMGVVKDCLRVNPDRRPDTATLLNLPVVRLMRKEREVADFSKMLKAKEDAVNKRIRELDQKISSVDADKVYMRQEIESSLRREWEVKARLEIDRLVNQEMERLQKKFEQEVQARVEAELLAQKKTVAFTEDEPPELSSSLSKSDYPHSSIGGGSADGDFPSTTDITDISLDSPDTSAQFLKKSARTPFARAQTMFAAGAPAGTPMDIEMASPSPITIASLSLSPRRNAATKAPTTNSANIFAGGDGRWDIARDLVGLPSDSDSDDDIPIPSPTRMIRSSKNPFTSKQRPTLHAQKSAPMNRLQSKQTLAPQARTTSAIPTMASNPDLPNARTGNGALRERGNSPSRRLSKIPSNSNLGAAAAANGSSGSGSEGGAVQRKPSATNIKKDAEPQPPVLSKVAGKNNIRGRTLVELQQARAGGRPVSAVMGGENNVSPKRAFRDHALAANRSAGTALEPAAVWDPERDEMPSPFLVRRRPISRV
jgi:NIMA (never in mitosis gene a)-related kinase